MADSGRQFSHTVVSVDMRLLNKNCNVYIPTTVMWV